MLRRAIAITLMALGAAGLARAQAPGRYTYPQPYPYAQQNPAPYPYPPYPPPDPYAPPVYAYPPRGQSARPPQVSTDPARGAAQRPNTVADAVSTPLQDVNVERRQIPQVLRHASADPYDLTGLLDCPSIAGEVLRLDAALGVDRDLPPPSEADPKPSRYARVESSAVSLLREGIQMIIPYRGLIRRFSGAARQQERIDKAIQGGDIRRGYLKGIGMRMNCPPPAAPSWFRPAPPPPQPVASLRSGPPRIR